jgi:hypothetical protein
MALMSAPQITGRQSINNFHSHASYRISQHFELTSINCEVCGQQKPRDIRPLALNLEPSYTVGGFLNSLGAVPLTGPGSPTYSGIPNAIAHTPVTSSTPIYSEPGGADGYSAYLEITGDVFLRKGDSILISHDDGVSLKLNGVAVSACTSAASTQCFTNFAPPYSGAAFERYQWNGPSGLINFDLVYTEGFDGPANLKMAVTSVPEPQAYAMTFSGLMIVSLIVNRRKRSAMKPT